MMLIDLYPEEYLGTTAYTEAARFTMFIDDLDSEQ